MHRSVQHKLETICERVIGAPPETVFTAFTSADGQEAFYGQDDPGWIVESACDLRVGGAWTIAFGPSQDELYRHRHVFEAIEPPRGLVLATTEIRPDGTTLVFATAFTFAPHDGGTRMSMTQSGFPTAAFRDEHSRGVPNALARLERAIHARR